MVWRVLSKKWCISKLELWQWKWFKDKIWRNIGKTKEVLAIDWMVEHEGETCKNNSDISKLWLAMQGNKHT